MNDRDRGLDQAEPISEDASARARALEPAASFIVQAPAGSGKTALLIQRYLVVLARAERPESVLAMTFTRKAAGEMQARVAAALEDAARESPLAEPPLSAHDATTRRLAQAVLARDARLGWNLLQHGSRLRIQTIDAFCAGLMMQMPLRSGIGALPRFVDDASVLYKAAATSALRRADASDVSWRELLAHLDNDADTTIALLADLLARREQWLRYLVVADPAALRNALESALAAEIALQLARVAPMLDANDRREMAEHLRYAVAHVAPGRFPDALIERAHRGELPAAGAHALDAWRALADWLLVMNDASFRRTMNLSEGFPPLKNARDAAARERKTSMQALLQRLGAVPGLARALHIARRLPPPAYSDAQWTFVTALIEVLPKLVAELEVTFAAAGTIDFAQATIAALRALGPSDAPTDLLLAIDLRLEHILVDEFQDTSYAQFELLERLVSGWQPGDGRTLFVVGDPMQSIYRFRNAEVGLFVKAASDGIGNIALERLRLRRNFRSRAGLVRWVNDVFPRVLPERDDPTRGAIAFAPAVASRDAEEGVEAVSLHIGRDDADESARVVDIIAATRAREPAARIAILVRARRHLGAMLSALTLRGIPYDAVELDTLGEHQTVIDLVALTHALAQPADRLAWLACLRAPWCGLTLADLLECAAPGPASLWDALRDETLLARLSGDGHARCNRLVRALHPLMEVRGRVALAAIVRGAWLALGGPACCDAEGLAAAGCYFRVLEAHAARADLADWGGFLHAIEHLRTHLPCGDSAAVQVMTLHRAKGLEFDVVIIPGLAREAKSSEGALLRWRERPQQGLLLAPMKPRSASRDQSEAIYEYLNTLIADEEDAELSRLLYVGVTRARERLHLVAALAADTGGTVPWKPPGGRTSLAKLWSLVHHQAPLPDATATGAAEQAPAVQSVPLRRLAADWSRPAASDLLRQAVADLREPIVFDWAQETARHVGTVAHRLLRQLGDEGPSAWSEPRVDAQRQRVRSELAQLGVAPPRIADAAEVVLDALRSTLSDPRGRWLFAGDHTQARNELALSGFVDGGLVNVVVDRAFVDASGTRWIVDFKLSVHEGGDREQFLRRERERYARQLELYASLFRHLETRPTRLALYFPRLGAWIDWASGHA